MASDEAERLQADADRRLQALARSVTGSGKKPPKATNPKRGKK